jgi:plastocyanin
MGPRTVVISAGGSVTFEIDGRHRVAIYAPDTDPSDITLPTIGAEITDADDRVALEPNPLATKTDVIWTTPPGTFGATGRYLVICTFVPHFQTGMYGWVNVPGN